MSRQYRQVAKKLNVKYLFGRWGIQTKPLSIVPLDGWLLDEDAAKEIVKNGLEL